VESPELIYSNGSASLSAARTLAADGTALMRKRDDAAWWLIPCNGLGHYKWHADKENPFFRDVTGVVVDNDAYCKEVHIDLARLFPGAAVESIEVLRCDEEGRPADRVVCDREKNVLTVRPSPEVRRYLVKRK
jgi:hypothetical protein